MGGQTNHPERRVEKALIYITYKQGLLGPQGQAIKKALSSLGFMGIEDVRVGKYIEIEIEESLSEELKSQVEKMCRELLANPVIEDYRVELLEKSKFNSPPPSDTQ